MASERTERLLELGELWNSGDLAGFLETLAPDFEFTPDPSFPVPLASGGAAERGGGPSEESERLPSADFGVTSPREEGPG